MKAEIIAIGTEVLMGQVVNTNAAFISQSLSELGIDLYYHTVVGDNPDRIKKVFQIALDRSDLIIFSGGLGPTKDDISKSIVADTLGLEVWEDQETLAEIKEIYQRSNRPMPASNVNQALIIENSQKIPNEVGMAPGSFLKHQGKIIAMVPGVPAEMKQMVTYHLLDLLQNELDDKAVLESKILRLYNITESQLAQSIDPVIEGQTNPTIAIYITDSEPTIRISAKADSSAHAQTLIQEVEDQIRDLVGDKIYGEGATTITDKVLSLLDQEGIRLNIIESGVHSILSSALLAPKAPHGLVESVLSFNDNAKLGKYFGHSELSSDQLQSLVQDQATALAGNGALLVLGRAGEANKLLKQVSLYFAVQGQTHHFDLDLSNRKTVSDKQIQVALMTKLYDLIK
ncbi:CinA-like protein [Alloiococcus otitis]|uniref:Putative competence-damage inducible protein n=1 Tax=Alloiococcus otitis ATCC 51267 TaxID=883081 RepID=K9ETZ8_9LACT|nr:CinA family nicotinamide mononucleotide deamidase-related protein [Alloiococcus otitis]EKU94417.1 competence/damage-inducible protein CinA domain [Alloiococcus otitis ATCC 51267]SUU81391.1 CinA-like protein [Alloiococcus otitis]